MIRAMIPLTFMVVAACGGSEADPSSLGNDCMRGCEVVRTDTTASGLISVPSCCDPSDTNEIDAGTCVPRMGDGECPTDVR